MPTSAVFNICDVPVYEAMTLRSTYEIQGKFQFFESDEQLRKEWRMNARTNIKHGTFLEGVLLKSLDTNNPFPYVDYAVFCSSLANTSSSSSSSSSSSHSNNKPHASTRSSQSMKHTTIRNGPAKLRGSGVYDELENVLRNDVRSLPRTPVSKDSVYILSAFQTDGHIGRLEETWKTWSGADYVLWKCPEKLKLRRITFLKATTDLDPFTFIILSECEDGLGICNTAREFVERLKDRRCGLVGLYQVERYYIASKTKT